MRTVALATLLVLCASPEAQAYRRATITIVREKPPGTRPLTDHEIDRLAGALDAQVKTLLTSVKATPERWDGLACAPCETLELREFRAGLVARKLEHEGKLPSVELTLHLRLAQLPEAGELAAHVEIDLNPLPAGRATKAYDVRFTDKTTEQLTISSAPHGSVTWTFTAPAGVRERLLEQKARFLAALQNPKRIPPADPALVARPFATKPEAPCVPFAHREATADERRAIAESFWAATEEFRVAAGAPLERGPRRPGWDGVICWSPEASSFASGTAPPWIAEKPFPNDAELVRTLAVEGGELKVHLTFATPRGGAARGWDRTFRKFERASVTEARLGSVVWFFEPYARTSAGVKKPRELVGTDGKPLPPWPSTLGLPGQFAIEVSGPRPMLEALVEKVDVRRVMAALQDGDGAVGHEFEVHEQGAAVRREDRFEKTPARAPAQPPPAREEPGASSPSAR